MAATERASVLPETLDRELTELAGRESTTRTTHDPLHHRHPGEEPVKTTITNLTNRAIRDIEAAGLNIELLTIRHDSGTVETTTVPTIVLEPVLVDTSGTGKLVATTHNRDGSTNTREYTVVLGGAQVASIDVEIDVPVVFRKDDQGGWAATTGGLPTTIPCPVEAADEATVIRAIAEEARQGQPVLATWAGVRPSPESQPTTVSMQGVPMVEDGVTSITGRLEGDVPSGTGHASLTMVVNGTEIIDPRVVRVEV